MSRVGPELLGQVYAQQGAALVLYARQWCDVPEDVVQESLLKLARQASVPENLLPWLYRVVRNGAVSAGRAAGRRRKYESRAAGREWFSPDPAAAMDGQAAAQAIETLPVAEREVLVARLWGGLTFAEIAVLIEATDSTAQRRYESALNALRERLGVPCPNRDNPKTS